MAYTDRLKSFSGLNILWNNNVPLTVPEGDGEGVWLSLPLSDEESSIPGDCHHIVLCLASAQVAVEPTAKCSFNIGICVEINVLFFCVYIGL